MNELMTHSTETTDGEDKKRLPPRSPFGLIQEDVWPDQWALLVVCMMLNCTSRKQVERVFPAFMERWPTPQAFMGAERSVVEALCKPMGFATRRTDNLLKMTTSYLTGPWSHARELHGVGEYAARAWEIFYLGVLGDTVPKDHALTDYWRWRKHHERKDT